MNRQHDKGLVSGMADSSADTSTLVSMTARITWPHRA